MMTCFRTYTHGSLLNLPPPPPLTMANPVLRGLQEDLPGQMDRYLVHGLEYKAVRDAVGKAVLECKPPAIAAALEVGRVLSWVTWDEAGEGVCWGGGQGDGAGVCEESDLRVLL